MKKDDGRVDHQDPPLQFFFWPKKLEWKSLEAHHFTLLYFSYNSKPEKRFNMEGGNCCIQVHLSFTQPKSPKIVCIPDVTFWSWLYTGISFEDSELASSMSF